MQMASLESPSGHHCRTLWAVLAVRASVPRVFKDSSGSHPCPDAHGHHSISPGERTCVGCAEPAQAVPSPGRAAATRAHGQMSRADLWELSCGQTHSQVADTFHRLCCFLSKPSGRQVSPLHPYFRIPVRVRVCAHLPRPQPSDTPAPTPPQHSTRSSLTFSHGASVH